jgi:hypothetical protein
MKTRLPVRSALFKHDTGGLVVKWVTISESLLLYVFAHYLHLFAFLFDSSDLKKQLYIGYFKWNASD